MEILLGQGDEEEDGDQEEEEDEDLEEETKKKWRGIAPVLGRNLLSVLLTDVINVIIAPSGVNLLALMLDSIIFILFPIIGGLVNMSVLYNYDQDPITFSNSGLQKQDLYTQLMVTIKDTFFSAIGRAEFFEDEDRRGEEYEVPQDTLLDDIYVPPVELDPLPAIDDVVVFPF